MEGGKGSIIDEFSSCRWLIGVNVKSIQSISYLLQEKEPTLINFLARDIWLSCEVETIVSKIYGGDI